MTTHARFPSFYTSFLSKHHVIRQIHCTPMEPVIKNERKNFQRKKWKTWVFKANKEMHVWNWLSGDFALSSYFHEQILNWTRIDKRCKYRGAACIRRLSEDFSCCPTYIMRMIFYIFNNMPRIKPEAIHFKRHEMNKFTQEGDKKLVPRVVWRRWRQ